MAIAPRTPDELLRDVPVLGELQVQDLVALAEAAEIRKLIRGAALFQEGQTA